MKLLHTSAGIITLILLQACSNQPAKSETAQTATVNTNADNSPRVINTSLKTGALNPDDYFSVPEAQIIHELYQSGCLIEEVEINRRVQHMRVSCANDKPFNSSI